MEEKLYVVCTRETLKEIRQESKEISIYRKSNKVNPNKLRKAEELGTDYVINHLVCNNDLITARDYSHHGVPQDIRANALLLLDSFGFNMYLQEFEYSNQKNFILTEEDNKYRAIGYDGKCFFLIDREGIKITENYYCIKRTESSNLFLVININDSSWADSYIINYKGKTLALVEAIPYIGSRRDTLNVYKTIDGDFYFDTGCFFGSLNEFELAVKKTHCENYNHYKSYMRVINKYKSTGVETSYIEEE